jgi:Tfp pilus assembly protein PilX
MLARDLARLSDEQGSVLAFALVVLGGLTALAMALLSISAHEPQISRNHVDMLRARYLAEGGLELAFDTLASTVGSWNAHLAGATCASGTLMPTAPLTGLRAGDGALDVRIRNDCDPADARFTGLATEAPADATRDTNSTVIVTSTGVVGATVQTLTAVVSHFGSEPQGQSVSRAEVRTYSWSDH